EGITVLELSFIVAGPTAGMILGDMGANVIKIEPPDAMQPSRIGTDRTGSFFFVNRNKRSLVIDLKMDEGRDLFYKLADGADVVVENMGPGTMERLGIGYEQVSSHNPRIIYCSVKGFLSGPYSDRTLLDEPAEMMSGLAYMTGPLGQPLRVGASVVDIGAATYAVTGVLGALLQRHETGRGQKITGGLFETALFWVGQHMAQTQTTGEPPVPTPERKRRSGGGGWTVYDLFDCADDRRVFIAVTSDAQWKRFCQALGLDDLLNDPELATNRERRVNRDRYLPRVAETLRSMKLDEVTDLLLSTGASVAPLHTPQDVLEDAHVNAEHRLLDVQAGDIQLRLPPLPYESSDYHFLNRVGPPHLPGLHTREVLTENGYTSVQIDEMLRTGVVKDSEGFASS
ncbi:MAG: CaiB/BaiF CoA-transferase family protein, partial [Dehalococcoidia bacterium]